jgi:hypothetical protein
LKQRRRLTLSGRDNVIRTPWCALDAGQQRFRGHIEIYGVFYCTLLGGDVMHFVKSNLFLQGDRGDFTVHQNNALYTETHLFRQCTTVHWGKLLLHLADADTGLCNGRRLRAKASESGTDFFYASLMLSCIDLKECQIRTRPLQQSSSFLIPCVSYV